MKRSAIGIIFYIILALILITSGDFYLKNKELSQIFFAAVCIICSIRFLHVFFFRRMSSANLKLNVILFRISVALTALVWGAGFAAFMTLEAEFNIKLAMAISTAGLCSGGVIAFLPDRNLALVFNSLIILPAGISLVVLQENIPIASMIFLYFIYLAFIGKRGNEEYWHSLENEHMLKEKSDELRIISRLDVLTGLYNRRYFDEVLNSEWKRASRDQKTLSLVIGDIDHFKSINDNHGHLAGDEYIKYVADKLKETFKRESDFVARYGGEEFIVILPDTNLKQACELTEKVREKIKNSSVDFESACIKTTISFGIASIVPDYKDSINTLIRSADKALYQAKNDGRNRIAVS